MDFLSRMLAEAKERTAPPEEMLIARLHVAVEQNQQELRQLECEGACRRLVLNTDYTWPYRDCERLDYERRETAIETMQLFWSEVAPFVCSKSQLFWSQQRMIRLAEHVSYGRQQAELVHFRKSTGPGADQHSIDRARHIVALQYFAFTSLCVGLTAKEIRGGRDPLTIHAIAGGEFWGSRAKKMRREYEDDGGNIISDLEARQAGNNVPRDLDPECGTTYPVMSQFGLVEMPLRNRPDE